MEDMNYSISNDDLQLIIKTNNNEMEKLINQEPLDIEKINELFVANINFYKMAVKRKMSVPGLNFMMVVATMIDYKPDVLLNLLNPNLISRLKSKSK